MNCFSGERVEEEVEGIEERRISGFQQSIRSRHSLHGNCLWQEPLNWCLKPHINKENFSLFDSKHFQVLANLQGMPIKCSIKYHLSECNNCMEETYWNTWHLYSREIGKWQISHYSHHFLQEKFPD